jgi:hypothetical protein
MREAVGPSASNVVNKTSKADRFGKREARPDSPRGESGADSANSVYFR